MEHLGGTDPVDRPVLRSRVWPVAGGVLVLLLLALAALGPGVPGAALAAVVIAAAVAAGVIGWAVLTTRRQRRAFEDELTAWASERAAQAERLRVARDLHDLASHGLGLITVRAASARAATGHGSDAERASALADIEQAGREATVELRRMLGVLRGPGAPGAPGAPAPLRPAETLADLPAIVAAAPAGVRAVLETEGLATEEDDGDRERGGDREDGGHGGDREDDGGSEGGGVSAGVQLSVCAVVREGLANVARHAGATSARVRVVRDGSGVGVTVTDDGPVPGWSPQPGAGHGLTGLTERVTAVGGTVEAGPAPGGFRLAARFPDGRPR